MQFDVVICDVDGCLAAEHGGPFHLDALAELAQHNRTAEREGGLPPITVCTGRPQPFAEAMSRLLSNSSTPSIAENGVWLYFPSENRYEIDPAITRDHLDAVHAASRLLDDQYRGHGFTQQPGKTASVTLYHPEPERLQEIMPAVRQTLADRGWPFRVSMTWNYINCDLEFVSKASGLRRFFAATGYEPARSLAIGDTMSDLPMAEGVGWFGCPANASEEIKQRATYISPHEQVEGVLDILRRAASGN